MSERTTNFDRGTMVGWAQKGFYVTRAELDAAKAENERLREDADNKRDYELIEAYTTGALDMRYRAAQAVREWQAYTLYNRERISDEMADEIMTFDPVSLDGEFSRADLEVQHQEMLAALEMVAKHADINDTPRLLECVQGVIAKVKDADQ